MEILSYGLIATFLLLFGVISNKIKTTFITGPIIFVFFGYLLSEDVLDLLTYKEPILINVVANFTLILVLFSDASRINFTLFKAEHDFPRRLLGIGLPLTILLGLLTALVLFSNLPLWEAAVLATILAPTDAALAQAVINSKGVPNRIREALNVESGLNDGICFPILLMFITLADETSAVSPTEYWIKFIIFQLILGPIVGALVGYLGGKLVSFAVKKRWMSEDYQRLSALALSFMAFCFASLVGGNGFIASFTAGLTFGNIARKVSKTSHHFTEAEGELLILLTFMLFGAILVPHGINNMTWDIIGYAFLSLTVVRMLPVYISLIGKKLSLGTITYLGWFGPRGVASILYLLLVVEEHDLGQEDLIFSVTTMTVLISVFLHGMTAVWGANRYISYLTSHSTSEEA